MKLTQLPLLTTVFESGDDDRIFDMLLLSGPFVVVVIALLGRTWATVGLTVSYISLFGLYILYKSFRDGP